MQGSQPSEKSLLLFRYREGMGADANEYQVLGDGDAGHARRWTVYQETLVAKWGSAHVVP